MENAKPQRDAKRRKLVGALLAGLLAGLVAAGLLPPEAAAVLGVL